MLKNMFMRELLSQSFDIYTHLSCQTSKRSKNQSVVTNFKVVFLLNSTEIFFDN